MPVNCAWNEDVTGYAFAHRAARAAQKAERHARRPLGFSHANILRGSAPETPNGGNDAWDRTTPKKGRAQRAG